MTVNPNTMQRVASFMRHLATTEFFPESERQHWESVCTQPEFVEQMLVHIAKHYHSNDEGMCKLLDIVDNHIAKEF